MHHSSNPEHTEAEGRLWLGCRCNVDVGSTQDLTLWRLTVSSSLARQQRADTLNETPPQPVVHCAPPVMDGGMRPAKRVEMPHTGTALGRRTTTFEPRHGLSRHEHGVIHRRAVPVCSVGTAHPV